MNKLTPYEKQLIGKMDDLPLPDEDIAWADMKRRLEKKEDQGIVIIPFLSGCAGWSLLFIVITVIAYYFFTGTQQLPEKMIKRNKAMLTELKIKPAERNSDRDSKPVESNKFSTGQDSIATSVPYRKKQPVEKNRIKKNELPAGINKKNKTGKEFLREPVNSPGDYKSLEKIDSILITSVIPVHEAKDTSAKRKEQEEKKKENKKIVYSAGLEINQLIKPVGAGAKAFYPDYLNINGSERNNKLLDYIPAVVGRIYWGDKWMLQTGFRYRAPQSEKDLVYNKRDSTATTGTISVQKIVSKTYYHQVPLTFHYSITKNWSLGTGIVWNRFSRAVTVEQEKSYTPAAPQLDSILSRKAARINKADSNFVRTYLQASVETQFRWKRFSLGINYSAGLQPWLKFTLPGGIKQEEKTHMLKLFLRYELWKKQKK